MATGYSKLGEFMIDQRYAIFRKFQHLAARDLLYRQAELVHLEIEHHNLEQLDRGCDDNRQFYDREWWHLSNSEANGLGGDQWNSALRIREKLTEYYEAVSQYTRITERPRPTKCELDLLRTWIIEPHLAGGCRFLGKDLSGFERDSVYEESFREDLMLLVNNRGEDDILTRLLCGPILKLFHHCFLKFFKAPTPLDPRSSSCSPSISSASTARSGLHHYSDDHVLFCANIIGTVASSFTPMLSIIVLSAVSNMHLRLGLVCVFSMIFSASLAIATKARRIDIFAATAAFASVQVVFVGSTTIASV